jgi:glutamate-1-semialdehyde aminotransferase
MVATKSVQADCPVGKKVVGGGYLLSFFGGATDVPLRLSVPTADLRSWVVSGTNFNNTLWGLSAIAICADAAD